MRRSFALVSFVVAAAATALLSAPARAQNPSPLGGVWTLNRSLSEFPRDIGFNVSWIPTSTADAPSSGGGGRGSRGGRGSSGGGSKRGSASPCYPRQESSEDARRLQLLTAEVRNPPTRLMIVDTPAAVTITNELGQSRTIHPDGKEETIEVQGVLIPVTSRRDGDRLVVVYRAEKDREIRYTLSASAGPPKLTVDVQFLERGTGDKARRVYDAGVATETAAPAGAAAPTGAAAPPAALKQPASGQPAPEAFDQRPGAELKGLTSLGILVEELGAQAVACGMSRDGIESALSKRLTAGGFTVRRNSDEDTYVYVNIMTTSGLGGLCVSRYDAFLYTQATARLSYHDQPVLVQVSLMHRGGMTSSTPTTHGATVVRGLESYVDLFATQIHDANK
jgi:hypothetical protein